MVYTERNSDHILKVSNLSVKLEKQIILDNISFKLQRGKTLSIVGPNGAGKTMLFRALLNLVPYTGKIEWNGKVKIGYVPQNFSVSEIPISVKEFLAFKKSNNVEYSFDSVELEEKIQNKRLNVLSGGELHKLLVAWALKDNPNVLLFDEPTTFMDMGSVEIIYEMLNKLEKERKITILLITHDAHVVRDYSDYVLALNKKMILFGESSKISDPSLLKEIYGSHTILSRHLH